MNPNDEVLLRSIALAPAQRLALIPMAAALIAIAPWTGWLTLIPIILTLAVFAALKRTRVQEEHGVITSYAAWALGTVGVCAIALCSDGHAYYMAPLMAIPTILGIAVFPVRQLPVLAFVMTTSIIATCWLADSDAVRDDPAPTLISAVLLGAIVLIGGTSRKAETDSFLESRVDPLTGAHNRLALDEHLETLPAALRDRQWTLILGDIDNFKRLNDRYGHAAGDRALRAVADHIRDNLPSGGRLYRFGGEEFLITLSDCDPATARRLAERIRVGLPGLDIGGPTVTMSFGVASHPTTEATRFDALFARADEAMYRAKESGRNAVVVAPALPAVRPPSRGPGELHDVTRMRRVTDEPRTRCSLIQGWFEREQMVDLMTRHYRGSRIADALIIAPLLLFIQRIGPATAILGLVALVLFRVTQACLTRLERPELLFVPAWVATQAVITLAIINGREGGPWGLFALSFLVVATSPALPWRLMSWGVAISGALTVLAAMTLNGPALTSEPQIVVTPLLLLLACAVVGRELGRRIMSMRRASLHDQLTGLPNRSSLKRRMDDALACAAQTGGFVSLIMADIDHFKRVNDTLGHSRGDAVLVTTTSRLQSRLRQSNALHRVGGEEFAILLPGVHEDIAVEIATRLRAAVAEGPVSGVPLTMSFGVASGGADTPHDELYRAADGALYRAKRSGRNRVERASESHFAPVPVVTRQQMSASR